MTTTATMVHGRAERAIPTSVERLAELVRAGLFPVVRVDGCYYLAETIARSGNTQWRVEFAPVGDGILPFSRIYCDTARVIRVEWP